MCAPAASSAAASRPAHGPLKRRDLLRSASTCGLHERGDRAPSRAVRGREKRPRSMQPERHRCIGLAGFAHCRLAAPGARETRIVPAGPAAVAGDFGAMLENPEHC